ncbi:hypothetical protein WDW37_06460 [Bdellovibrionota bacterium FG-1]
MSQPETTTGHCWKCGQALTLLDYGRQDSCRKCGLDTRVCKNCIHYDLDYNNHCRENQADRVVEKERANFCDYFKPKAGGGANAPTRDHLKAAADALFKKGT